MHRREFLKTAASASAVALGKKSLAKAVGGEVSPVKRKIGYIRPQIPFVEIPAYKGTYYADQVPDTFDIIERGRLVLSALTSITDPEADYEIYLHLQVFSNPPSMIHDFSDWCQESEGFVEALPLIRMMTGDGINPEVERAWTDVILESIGPDGLFYFPTEGRPWFFQETHRDAFPGAADPDEHVDMNHFVPWIVLPDGVKSTADRAAYTQYAHPQPTARLLGAMTIYWMRSKNPLWKQSIERMIDRWVQLATYKDDYAYYPRAMFAPNAAPTNDLEMPVGLWCVEASGRLVQGLAQYYRVSGYEPARTLAEKIVRYVRYHGEYFDATDGRFLAGPDNGLAHAAMEFNAQDAVYGGHFHGHTIGLLAILDYAAAVNDPELTQFVRKSFEWSMNHQDNIEPIGYFPTQLVPDLKRMVEQTPAGPVESCEVADMIALGAKLSELGVGDYWDHVDHWLRNQFAENQLTESDWIYRLAQTQDKINVLPNETADRPAERNIGGFAGWSAINDWVVRHKTHRFGIMHCCTGNAARAIYYTWQKMVSFDQGTLKVHLLMNHASEWADVYSYIPNQGRVDVKIKKPCQAVLLRVPEWVEASGNSVVCRVNGKDAKFDWSGRYIKIGALAPGDRVTMTFPISERTIKVTTLGVEYTLVLRGSTVVSIDPPGKYCPYYQRANYREETVKWRQVRRFVSDQEIAW